MDEQKILFADLFQHLKSIREGVKIIDKGIQSLINGDSWQGITLTLNGIVAEARIMQATSAAMENNIDFFLANGPYIGQRAGKLPMEEMVEP